MGILVYFFSMGSAGLIPSTVLVLPVPAVVVAVVVER